MTSAIGMGPSRYPSLSAKRSATEKRHVVAICRRTRARIGSFRANSIVISVVAAYVGGHVPSGVGADGGRLGVREMKGLVKGELRGVTWGGSRRLIFGSSSTTPFLPHVPYTHRALQGPSLPMLAGTRPSATLLSRSGTTPAV